MKAILICMPVYTSFQVDIQIYEDIIGQSGDMILSSHITRNCNEPTYIYNVCVCNKGSSPYINLSLGSNLIMVHSVCFHENI